MTEPGEKLYSTVTVSASHHWNALKTLKHPRNLPHNREYTVYLYQVAILSFAIILIRDFLRAPAKTSKQSRLLHVLGSDGYAFSKFKRFQPFINYFSYMEYIVHLKKCT